MSLTREKIEDVRRLFLEAGRAPMKSTINALCDLAMRGLEREGMVMVPREPTDDMLAALHSYAGDEDDHWRASAAIKWRNLLSAAQKERT